MQQPELGQRLSFLRKEKHMTQEELAIASRVSARTIQRIEAGEVLPRMSTVKILLEALGKDPELFSSPTSTIMNTSAKPATPGRNVLLIAVFAGAIYLAVEIILSVLDVLWLTQSGEWAPWLNLMYISLTIVMMIAYVLFIRGFIALSAIFENSLLKIACYFMAVTIISIGVLDISTLRSEDIDLLLIPYGAAAVLLGSVMIIFGVGLIRLQDGIGELSRAAGVMEILAGCTLVTVVLFFIGYVITVPATIVEILILYRGYEYLSRSASSGNLTAAEHAA